MMLALGEERAGPILERFDTEEVRDLSQAMVTLGTGIGAGFVTGGRLLWGAEGYAGEVGHMLVARDGPFHHTGQQGPWEHFASGTALGRLGREAAAEESTGSKLLCGLERLAK